MPRFFRRVAEGVWDIDDLHRRTDELAAFVARAREIYKLGPLIAVGYSNGANIAWSLLLRRPDLLAGAVLMRAMLPFDPQPVPSHHRLVALPTDRWCRRRNAIASRRC